MQIIISGYGKMGKKIEQVALKRKHHIIHIIDTIRDWDALKKGVLKADAIIDFSLPQVAPDNIKKAFDYNIPIISGTTGWEDQKEEIIELCQKKQQTLFYAPNFSIGVNIFFEINRVLSRLMISHKDYDVHIEETHHTHKLDKPSGTAIHLANDILKLHKHKKNWQLAPVAEKSSLGIVSKREGHVIGTHKVVYHSAIDQIALEHESNNREGFALGAVLAAEWVHNKKGFYEMKDMLNFNK